MHLLNNIIAGKIVRIVQQMVYVEKNIHDNIKHYAHHAAVKKKHSNQDPYYES